MKNSNVPKTASVLWCNPISTSFGKEGKGEAELKTKQVLAKHPQKTLDPFHMYRGQFPEPKESLGTTMVPNGKLFSNLHSTGKLKVLEESGMEGTFNRRLWAFLT